MEADQYLKILFCKSGGNALHKRKRQQYADIGVQIPVTFSPIKIPGQKTSYKSYESKMALARETSYIYYLSNRQEKVVVI